jgi:hypothetical protein
LAVPELTRGGDIKLTERVSLRRLVRSRYGLPMMQERLSNVVLTAALVVVAAAWLWFLLAYADLIFRR